jgi:hypothetical protein
MRVSDEQLKTVGFMCAEIEAAAGSKERVPVGTAFFVLVNDDDVRIAYAVAAAHVIQGIGTRPFFLRVNADDNALDGERGRG